MEYLVDLVQQLNKLGPELLLGLGMIGLGYALRLTPFPIRWVPGLCMFLPMVIYPMMADPGRLKDFPHFPQVRFALEGLVIGVLAWMLHNKVLKKLEDKFLNGNGTPPTPPPPNPPPTTG